MTTIHTNHFGTANFLDCTNILLHAPRKKLDLYDPAVVREAIGVPEIQKDLFPMIQSGVRFWPYLLIAHELRYEQRPDTIDEKLQSLQRRQNAYKEKGYYIRSFGPKFANTFKPYQNMYKKVCQQVKAGDLYSLLTMRSRYRGQPEFFRKHGKRWENALRNSMGTKGRQFADLLLRLRNKDENSSVVDRAITELLQKPEYDQLLRRGAFCYAFLRCLYGIKTSIEGIRPYVRGAEWATLLARELKRPRSHFYEYADFLPLVEKSIDKPALELQHDKVREDNGVVLASLGFHVFYNLYVVHTPKGKVWP